MAATQKEFDELVRKVEEFSQRHPESYRFRVTLFAVLGYAYIFIILAALFTLIGLVDELTTKLQAPRFHNILLNKEFNAAVVQVPRLGIFGWQENYLLLGIPLMQSLSLEQFKAVLAHELGHLSGNHSRFAGWIYRIRKTWLQIYERLYESEQHGASILFNRFLKWYWPSFNAYSFILARMDEYEADRCAAQLAGVRHAAEALINLHIKASFLESSFWSDIHNQIQDRVDPPDIESKLQALEQEEQVQTLDEGKAWERIHYTLKLRGGEAALPLLQDVLKTQPDCAQANYTLGQVLLQKDDVAGIACIEKAMAQRIDWVIDGLGLIYSFFWQRGQTDEAEKYCDRAEQHSQLLLKAGQERADVSDRDQLKPHFLKVSEVNSLKQNLASYAQVKEAYLVEKVVTYFPEERFCVLGIVCKRGWIESEDVYQKLVDLLCTNLQFSTPTCVIILNHGGNGNLRKKICQVKGSLILRR